MPAATSGAHPLRSVVGVFAVERGSEGEKGVVVVGGESMCSRT